MLLAGLASGKSASISRSEERAHHDVKSMRHLSFDTHSGMLRKSISYFGSPFAGNAHVHSSQSPIQDILII